MCGQHELSKCISSLKSQVGVLQINSKFGVSTPALGPFKCYVTLEGVGGCMPKRYEALRGGGGGGYVSVT